jgi:hypothetical protein
MCHICVTVVCRAHGIRPSTCTFVSGIGVGAEGVEPSGPPRPDPLIGRGRPTTPPPIGSDVSLGGEVPHLPALLRLRDGRIGRLPNQGVAKRGHLGGLITHLMTLCRCACSPPVETDRSVLAAQSAGQGVLELDNKAPPVSAVARDQAGRGLSRNDAALATTPTASNASASTEPAGVRSQIRVQRVRPGGEKRRHPHHQSSEAAQPVSPSACSRAGPPATPPSDDRPGRQSHRARPIPATRVSLNTPGKS